MCYYCCYLTHLQTSSSASSNIHDNQQHISPNFKYRRTRSYHLTIPLCLVSLTLFFILLNVTLVLSQSSEIGQGGAQASNKMFQENSQVVSGINTVRAEDQIQSNDRQDSSSSQSDDLNSTFSPRKAKRLTFEKRLIRDLLNNYPTTYARPIQNVSEPLPVSFGLTLTQLFDVGSTGQKMQTNTWKTLIWQDMNLVWNPNDYGGLKTVCLPADSIWTPDIVLYNYADERLKDWREISAVIQHTGDILYVPATMQFSVCFLDITNFPYDVHECPMKYRSWTYDHTKVMLTFKDDIPAIDMTSYVNSNEWRVTPLEALRTINDTFSLLTYAMNIQRKGGLYGYILILPCLLLSAATMVVFWIPPESPSKMILTVSIFSGLFLLLLLLAESLPGGGGTPKIGYYYCMNMVVVSVTAVLATIVIHIYVRGDRRQPVPPYIRRIFLQFLARLYCMAPKTPPSLPAGISSRYGSPLPGALLLPEQIFLTPHYHEEEFSKKLKLLKQRFQEFHRQQQQQQQQNLSNGNSVTNDTVAALSVNLRSIENDLKEIRDYLRHMKKKVEDTERSNKAANDWKQVALVLDRTFFFAYCCWLVLSLVVMFPKTTNISKAVWSTTPPSTMTNGTTNITM